MRADPRSRLRRTRRGSRHARLVSAAPARERWIERAMSSGRVSCRSGPSNRASSGAWLHCAAYAHDAIDSRTMQQHDQRMSDALRTSSGLKEIVADTTQWAFPASLQPKPGDARLRPRLRARRRGHRACGDSGRRVHGVDPRDRAHRQRRRYPRRRPDPDDRLPDHRGARRSGSRPTTGACFRGTRWPTISRPASDSCSRSAG